MQTVKFYTLGCKVNQYDTQVIREQFLAAGCVEINNHLPADIYVINTCTVTHRADADSLNLIRRMKRENPQARIVVTGCLTELDEDRIRGAGQINLIVKNKDKGLILELLKAGNGQNKPSVEKVAQQPGIAYFAGHTRAFLKIQDGCDYFCSYCKVPLVRGRSHSKSLNEVIAEATNLVKNGFKEIVLCGICLGAYGKDLNPKTDLIDVINALEKIAGLLRIRLSSIEPGDVSEVLIDKIAESQKVCRHLHIPLQSGNNEILQKMNRHYTKGDYLNLIKKIKDGIPLVTITTDVLIGFPSESEENFQDTVELVKDILPLKVHIFPYSLRIGTSASSFKDALKSEVIKDRITRLKKVAHTCAAIYKKQFLNKTMDVLIEGRLKNAPGLCWGYTDNYIRVLVKSDRHLSNQLISVKLKEIVKDHIMAGDT
jgi:threonylcarbamoyladenosine tRNA methylthiotransferase MtaB